MENELIRIIDEVVLIKEVTFADFITESRTGTMTFIRPDNGKKSIVNLSTRIGRLPRRLRNYPHRFPSVFT